MDLDDEFGEWSLPEPHSSHVANYIIPIDASLSIASGMPPYNMDMDWAYSNMMPTVLQRSEPDSFGQVESHTAPGQDSESTAPVLRVKQLPSRPRLVLLPKSTPLFRVQSNDQPDAHQHTAEEWESHKAEIRRLYIDENMSLKGVMAFMEKQGFKATLMMYKKRITKWRLFKNMRRDDAENIAQMQLTRKRQGKDSHVLLNGRRVNFERYMRRKGMTLTDLVPSRGAADAHDYLRCRTPSPVPDVGISRFGSFGPIPFDNGAPGSGIQSIGRLLWAIQLYNSEPIGMLPCELQAKLASRLVESAFEGLHRVLYVNSPYEYYVGLLCVLHIISERRTIPGIVNEMWRYLAAYSALVMGETHWFHVLLDAMYYASRDGSQPDAVKILEFMDLMATEEPSHKPALSNPLDTMSLPPTTLSRCLALTSDAYLKRSIRAIVISDLTFLMNPIYIEIARISWCMRRYLERSETPWRVTEAENDARFFEELNGHAHGDLSRKYVAWWLSLPDDEQGYHSVQETILSRTICI